MQDLLYALLMLDSLLDAGPPSSPQECIERARHLELGREHQKYLAGSRADLKLGREPKAEQLPDVVGVEEEKRPQTPPPPPSAAAGRGDARREDRRDAHFDAGGAEGEGDEDLRHARGRAGLHAERVARAQDAAEARCVATTIVPGELVARVVAGARGPARARSSSSRRRGGRRGFGLRGRRAVLWQAGAASLEAVGSSK